MDFEFTEEQLAIREMARKFTAKEVAPLYKKWDREKKFPFPLHKKLGELGFLGMAIPADKGGMGASFVTEGMVCEEVSKGDCALTMPTFVVGHLTAEIMSNGNNRIRKEFLEPFLSGDMVTAFAITEPSSGTDAAAMKSTAVKKGKKYILNGEKASITSCMDADVATILVRTDTKKGAKGISCFMVPLKDYPGITLQYYEDLGVKSVRRGSIFMDNVEIPEEYLVGEEGQGFVMAMKGFDISRILLALEALGGALVSLEETIEYTKLRDTLLVGPWRHGRVCPFPSLSISACWKPYGCSVIRGCGSAIMASPVRRLPEW